MPPRNPPKVSLLSLMTATFDKKCDKMLHPPKYPLKVSLRSL